MISRKNIRGSFPWIFSTIYFLLANLIIFIFTGCVIDAKENTSPALTTNSQRHEVTYSQSDSMIVPKGCIKVYDENTFTWILNCPEINPPTLLTNNTGGN